MKDSLSYGRPFCPFWHWFHQVKKHQARSAQCCNGSLSAALSITDVREIFSGPGSNHFDECLLSSEFLLSPIFTTKTGRVCTWPHRSSEQTGERASAVQVQVHWSSSRALEIFKCCPIQFWRPSASMSYVQHCIELPWHCSQTDITLLGLRSLLPPFLPLTVYPYLDTIYYSTLHPQMYYKYDDGSSTRMNDILK